MPKKSFPNIQWRDGVAQLRIKIDGVLYRESLHTSNFNLAVERREQRIAEIRTGQVAESMAWATPGAPLAHRRDDMSLDKMRAFDCARMRRNSTQRIVDTTIGYSWKRLMARFNYASEITADSLGLYVDNALLHKTVGRKTLREDIAAAKRGYHWAKEQHPTLPPLGTLPKLKRDEPGKGKGVFIEPSILTAWLDGMLPHARAKAIISLTTGIRWGEFRRFQGSWLTRIEHDGKAYGMLALPAAATKAKRARNIIVCDEVRRLIFECAPFQNDPQKHWNTRARQVGFPKGIYMRDLRTTFATMLGGFDWPGLCLVMGHKGSQSDAVAMRYQRADVARLAALADQVARVFGHLFGAVVTPVVTVAF